MTGLNTFGQLGLDDTTNRNTFTQVGSDVWGYGSGGRLFSLNFTNTAVMYGTGDNGSGELGIGNEVNKDEFTETVDSVPLDGILDIWEFVTCGSSHSMALKIVSATTTTTITYNDDDEPQIWSLPTGGPSL